MVVLALLLMPARAQALIVDTPRYRVSATRVKTPKVPSTPDADRVCTLRVSAEPSGLTRQPVACPTALREQAEAAFDAWDWRLSTHPETVDEIGQLSLVFPTEDDPRTAAFLQITARDTLRVEVPMSIVCLGSLCGARNAPPRPRPVAVDPKHRVPDCDLEIAVDLFGEAKVASVEGCPAHMHPAAVRFVEGRGGWHCDTDGVPTACTQSVRVFGDQL